jgi:hypothetical protein
MTDQISFTLTPELLGVLGAIAGGKPGPVSPLNYGKHVPDTKTGIPRLAALGICDTAGTITPDKLAAVTALARAEGFTRIYLTTPERVIEYIAYFAPGGAIVGVTNDNGMQLVSWPAPNDAMLEMVRQMIGLSIYRSGSFTARLNREETLVLSAMIDLQRKEMLRKFADGATADRSVISPAAVTGMLAIPPGNYQWFSSAFTDLFTQARIPKPDAIGGVLASLAAKGFARAEGKGYVLSDECILLARAHLLPSMYLTLTSGKGTAAGKANVTGFSCIISGVHELLYIDPYAGETELHSMASAEVHEYVKAFLTDRAVIDKIETVPAPATGVSKHFCPQCGAPVKPGLKFCNNCGAKIA